MQSAIAALTPTPIPVAAAFVTSKACSLLVGACVGTVVGQLVPVSGALVGACVGAAVGALVGACVGTAVGALVGACVGTAVGALVGACVGSAVGSCAGAIVGAVVVGAQLASGGSQTCVFRHAGVSAQSHSGLTLMLQKEVGVLEHRPDSAPVKLFMCNCREVSAVIFPTAAGIRPVS